MKDYSKGKIYAIRSDETDTFYIGSTICRLSKRLWGHTSAFNAWIEDTESKFVSSFEVMKFDDHYIELLENCPCESQEELFKREGELIRQHRPLCINKNIAGRTKTEWIADNKDYIRKWQKKYRLINKDYLAKMNKKYKKEHKDDIKERDVKYYIDNADTIKTRRLERYEQNKDVEKQKMRQYYEKNKGTMVMSDEMKAHRSEKIACSLCNSMVARANISTHKKSVKCKSLQL